MRLFLVIPACILAVASSSSAGTRAGSHSDVAALQVALRAAGTYAGTVDGVPGAGTTQAVIDFQKRKGLVPDGVAGPRTRQALGRLGSPSLGQRPLATGAVGWDVAELQFLLARHGFPSGRFDGVFGTRLEAAVQGFQRHAGVPQLGTVGPLTLAALRRPVPSSPIALRRPVDGPLGDTFGPRGDRFHAGVDFVAPAGAPVASAQAGLVTWAGLRGSFGNAVVVAHGEGVRTLYAHLSRVDVAVGARVATGAQVGLVGSTGRSTGPHLHFEVLVRGAAVDPLNAIG